MNKIILLLIFLMASVQIALAQSTNIPLNRPDYQWLDRLEIKGGKFADEFNSFNKGISRVHAIRFINNLDSDKITLTTVDEKNIKWMYNDNFEYAGEDADVENKYALFNVLYDKTTDFFAYQNKDFVIKLNPVLFYQGGGSTDEAHYKFFNTRGFEVRGNILGKLGFYTYFGENQWSAPNYVQRYIDSSGAVPGEGYFKTVDKMKKRIKYRGVDFMDARGYFTFSALKDIVRFTFGQDKNFLGYGMRSLFLSDNSNSNLFLKVNTHYGKFDYQNLFTQLIKQHVVGQGDYLYPKKFAAFHHLNYNFTDNIKAGLFEGVIFSRNNQYELQYLNPVIFYRQVEQALGSPDNAVMGADATGMFFKHFQLYGQFFLDELNVKYLKQNPYNWTNKFGLQAGLKYVDVFGIRNFDLQGEFNYVRPFTYSHKDSLANYTSYNQPLAHPSGANFMEVCGKLFYQPTQKFTITFSTAFQHIGLDTAGSDWGHNPTVSYTNRISRSNITNYDIGYVYATGGGVATVISVSDLVISYQFHHNMYLDFNYIHRTQNSVVHYLNQYEDYYAVGLRINFSRNSFLF